MTVACRVPRREVGLTGHSIILYMSSGARALLIALCLPGAYKWRETWVYIQQWAAAWPVFSIERAEWRIAILCVNLVLFNCPSATHAI